MTPPFYSISFLTVAQHLMYTKHAKQEREEQLCKYMNIHNTKLNRHVSFVFCFNQLSQLQRELGSGEKVLLAFTDRRKWYNHDDWMERIVLWCLYQAYQLKQKSITPTLPPNDHCFSFILSLFVKNTNFLPQRVSPFCCLVFLQRIMIPYTCISRISATRRYFPYCSNHSLGTNRYICNSNLGR